jgi:hypothetical protein
MVPGAGGPLTDYSEYADHDGEYHHDVTVYSRTSSLSGAAEALRNQSIVAGDRTYPHPTANAARPNTGHTTPTQTREEGDMVTMLLEEVHNLRSIVERECLKRSDMKDEFRKWREIMYECTYNELNEWELTNVGHTTRRR